MADKLNELTEDASKFADRLPKNENNVFRRQARNDDFLSMFQDPTTLGFKLFFINIGSATATGTLNFKDLKNLIKPGGLESFLEDSNVETLNVTNSTGLFGNIDNPNSALYYLKKMGDVARVTMLVDFIETLSRLNSEFPWYFQSIDGLSDAWARDFNKPKFKKEVTISCLESIDLRITALMDLYRKIAYDWKNRRCILPENLRKFEMTIKVYDIRNFKKSPKNLMGVPTEFNSNKYKINSEFLGEDYTDTTQITFNLSHCEFLPDESGAMLGTVSNSSYENASQSIKISYENIEEDSIYRILATLSKTEKYYKVKDYLNAEMDFLKGKDGLNDLAFQPPEMQGIFGSLIDDITQNVSSQAANLVKNKLSSLFIGNVYGFSASNILGNARNAIVNAPGRVLKGADKKLKDLGNTFGKDKK
tara:strand:- start:216 stop:1475 length:1260 start_codon:yes stop_codon:yes gene_type:complete